MPFPFALSRMIAVSAIIITNLVSLILSTITFHEKTGGVFQILAICFGLLSLLTILGCYCHQIAHQGEEANNTRNLVLFNACGLFGFALAAPLTVHARQDGGLGLCTDFAHAAKPCTLAGVQLGMAYLSPVIAALGFIVSWIDKFPGAVKVTPRYPITDAPDQHFVAYKMDEIFTRPPMKASGRSRNNSEWTDIPL